MALLSDLYLRLFRHRLRAIEAHYNRPITLQEQQLSTLMQALSQTQYGKYYGITAQSSYAKFAQQVPIVGYEEIAPKIEAMLRGEYNVLCPGMVKWFAKSSGTTNAKSKFIPVSSSHLSASHIQGGKDAMLLYIRNHPNTKVLSGKHFALSGSLTSNPFGGKGIGVGDLSAVLVSNLPRWIRPMRVPALKTALLTNWEEKRPQIAKDLAQCPSLATLSGVPSWTLSIIQEALRQQGVSSAHELWPHLELFWHGGIAFTPYRSEFERLFEDNLNFVEIYNASEAFIAQQDVPNDPAMLLMLDYGTLYEFIPMDQYDESQEMSAIPLSEVQCGVNYALIMTTLGGLTRYLIGDTIQFTSTNPYKIVITGRTKHFINAFGEELMVGNADAAFRIATAETHSSLSEYSAGPVFLTNKGQGYHHWIVEWATPPRDLDQFVQCFDNALKQLNSDYEAKRHGDISLLLPVITSVPQGTFFQWLKERGKLGGQHKVPRLSKDDSIVCQLLELSKQKL